LRWGGHGRGWRTRATRWHGLTLSRSLSLVLLLQLCVLLMLWWWWLLLLRVLWLGNLVLCVLLGR
jgi:hypothetical protein